MPRTNIKYLRTTLVWLVILALPAGAYAQPFNSPKPDFPCYLSAPGKSIKPAGKIMAEKSRYRKSQNRFLGGKTNRRSPPCYDLASLVGPLLSVGENQKRSRS